MWNGPSTVAGVAAGVEAVVHLHDEHAQAEHVGGEDELLALLVADLAGAVSHSIAAIHSGSVSRHLAGEVVQVLHQRR